MNKAFKLISNEQADYSTDIVILSIHNECGNEVFKKSGFLDYVQDNKIKNVRILNKKTGAAIMYKMFENSTGCYTSTIDDKCYEIRYILLYFMKNRPKWIMLYLCFKEHGMVWIDVFRNMVYYYVNYINGRTLEEFRRNGIR